MADDNISDERISEFFRVLGISLKEAAESLKRLSDALSDGEGDDVD